MSTKVKDEDNGAGKFNFSFKLGLPKLEECTNYDHYKNELKAWSEFAGVPASRQAGVVAFSLPHNHDTKIREKVFQSITVEKMKQEDGFKNLLDFMDSIFKKDVLVDAWEKFDRFESLKRTSGKDMSAFTNDFDLAHNELEKLDLKIPKSLLAFKLLKSANITHEKLLLVLTGMNFKEKDGLYEQAQSSLKKFCCESTSSGVENESKGKPDIKFESRDREDVMMNNWHGHNPRYRGGQGNRGRGSGRPFTRARGGRPPVQQRGRFNPPGRDGHPLLCHLCKSPEHMMSECPRNWNNFLVDYDRGDHNSNCNDEREIVMTASVVVLADSLGKITENEGHAILDTACSSTVCGKEWLKAYVNTLSEDAKKKVKLEDSDKKFRFGGGETLMSKGLYTIPGIIVGKSVQIRTDVVDSGIPLLLSKDSMKAAKMKNMNLMNDTAEILGVETKLGTTKSGHWYIDIGPQLDEIQGETIDVESVCAVNLLKLPMQPLKKVLLKIHAQFGHTSAERLKLLLKDCGAYRENMKEIVEEIRSHCEICKLYARTPPRPAVSAPMAREFNEMVAVDLKKWRNRWILHMVDMSTRFTISVFIDRKRPSDVIDAIMRHWIGAGYGIMGTLLSDNGGEFSAEEIREVCSILSIEVMTTAAESPFSNGLCERNHAIVDNMLLKLEEQCPKTPLALLLCWANNAKNSLQMNNGYSSFQLLFGRNPRLPNVMNDKVPALDGTTSSETFAHHLNGLHAARRAFIETETSERVRRALRANIRCSGERYESGDKVFYKREKSEKWLGPGRVIFQDGKIVFVRHGGVYVRVSTSRIVKSNGDGECAKQKEEEKIQPNDNNDIGLRGNQFERQVRQTEEHNEPNVKCFSRNVGDEAQNQPTITLNDDAQLRQRDTGTASAPVTEVPIEQTVPVRVEAESETVVEDASQTPLASQTPASQSQETSVPIESCPRKTRNQPRYDYKKLHEEGVKTLKEPAVLANFSPKTNEEKLATEAAKLSELQNWKKYEVYEEVPDEGQVSVSMRWVLTEKDDHGIKKVKARLVARGFEEPMKIEADSPTTAKESLRLVLGLSATLHWNCNTIDIRAAFLQGKEIDRDVFLKPPKDLKLEGQLWKLKRTVYGLVDASRSWYINVRDTLLELGCKKSSLDEALFSWYDEKGKLSGLFAIHVDDFIWAGSALFRDKVILALSTKFEIGKEANETFRYIGLDIVQNDEGIMLSQRTYSEEMEFIDISKSRQSQRLLSLSENEQKTLRGTVGKLNWMATQTRPDLSFETLDLSMGVNNAKVDDLLLANKAIRRMKNDHCYLWFPDLGSLENLRFVVFSDASHANLRDGASSAEGYVIFLVGENGASCPLVWRSTKIRRVVKSTLSAEAMALCDAIDDAIYLRKLFYEMLGKNVDIPIDAFVDNRSLVENLLSTKAAQEKALRIDLAAMKQRLSRGEVRRVQWVESKRQLADSLTKRGPSTAELRGVFCHGLKSFMCTVSCH